MSALCAACAAGPTNVEGHPDLLARSLGAHGMAFSCRRCATLWSRTYSTHEEFSWERSAATDREVGMRLPLSAGAPMSPARMHSAPGAADHWLAVQLSWKRPKRDR